MRPLTLFPAFALFLFVHSTYAASVPECQVRVLQAVTDDLGNHWQAGKLLPVDIERDNAQGGLYCASGGSCIPRKVNGSDALRLTNCVVGESIGGTDHALVSSSTLAGNGTAQAMLSRDEVSKKLSDLGFSNAAAGSLADNYVSHPHSTNGRLVARALAGSSSALATLKRNHS